jgi:hypothetical protein
MNQAPSSDRGRQRMRGDDDGGYVLIMTALLLIPLMITTAFAVDLGSWYAQATKIQRAADAASLAGVPWVTSSPTKAFQIARDVAAQNGFTSGVTVSQPSVNQLSVSIASSGSLFFARVGGLNSETLNRAATAEYIPGVPMGSPQGFMGADADSGIDNNYWLTNGSYMTPKINGDRYNTSVCSTPASPGTTSMLGCSGTGTNTNNERLADGYTFKVHNDGTGPGGSLDIQVFDPQYSNQDGFCNTNMPTAANLTTLAASTQWGSVYSNISNRWGVGGTNGVNTAPMKYCPGDDDTALNASATPPITPQNVTYIVEAPDSTPTDDTDNPPICAITFGGYNQNVFSLLDKTQQGNTLLQPENVKFGTHFHAWFTICHVASPITGDYIVHIKTTADQSNKGATPQTTATAGLNIGSLGSNIAPSTAGMQRYALRAGWSIPNPDAGTIAIPTGTSPNETGLNVFADGQLPIYAHGTTTTPFDLARITPEYKGTTLVFDFWDIGDGADESITVTPPPDAVNPPTTCTWTRDGVDLASAGTSATVSGCSVSNMTTGNFNGRLTTATVSIPTNYSCTPTGGSNPQDCWFGVALNYGNGTPQDTTTWTAKVLGNPVHLTQ